MSLLDFSFPFVFFSFFCFINEFFQLMLHKSTLWYGLVVIFPAFLFSFDIICYFVNCWFCCCCCGCSSSNKGTFNAFWYGFISFMNAVHLDEFEQTLETNKFLSVIEIKKTPNFRAFLSSKYLFNLIVFVFFLLSWVLNACLNSW